jgi:hypothetical protein
LHLVCQTRYNLKNDTSEETIWHAMQ